MRELIPDLVAGVVVAAAFLAGIGFAYRRGFRAALPVRSATFDFLPTSLAFDGSFWTLAQKLPGEWNAPARLEFQQAGSRITGQGRDVAGTMWQMEGVAHGDRLICLAKPSSQADVHPVIWMLRADLPGGTCSGYALGWDQFGTSLSVREMSFAQQANAGESSSSGR